MRSLGWNIHSMSLTPISKEETVLRHVSGRELRCACHFTEGVGWGVDEQGRVHWLHESKGSCLPKEAAIQLRRLELRKEYLDKFPCDSMPISDGYDLWGKLSEVILDLIEKGKQGEWLSEGSSGAHDWGGYFYLQTVQEITGIPYDQLWEHVYRMQANKQIQLEGMVVQEYYELPEALWEEYARIEYEGYVGIAKLPSHSKMPQHWEIVILSQNGRLIAEGIEGPPLMYSPDFGVDVEDVANVETAIKLGIDGYLFDPMSQA